MARENLPNRLRAEQGVKAEDTARQKFVSRFYNQAWVKEFGPDAVTAERAKVDPALMDAINIALARQVPSEEMMTMTNLWRPGRRRITKRGSEVGGNMKNESFRR
jgi:hypothetical protein